MAGFISDCFSEIKEPHDENQQPEIGVIFEDDFLSTSELVFENRTESPDYEENMMFVVENEDQEPEMDCRSVGRSINLTSLL